MSWLHISRHPQFISQRNAFLMRKTRHNGNKIKNNVLQKKGGETRPKRLLTATKTKVLNKKKLSSPVHRQIKHLLKNIISSSPRIHIFKRNIAREKNETGHKEDRLNVKWRPPLPMHKRKRWQEFTLNTHLPEVDISWTSG